MWLSGYQRIDLGPDGGVYDETAHPKGCIHTTEGSTLVGAESAYRNYPPHIGYDPIKRTKHQYIALNRYSYAFKGSESDDEFIIQIEIVGFARQTHLWSDQVYRNIAEDIIKPLEDSVGIPRNTLRFYGEGEGIILASPDSPIRLSANELRNYSGWLGHQHIPRPDAHWDPGRFQILKCFNHLGRRELDMSVRLQRGDSTAKDPNGTPYGDYTYMVKYDPDLPGGAVRKYMEYGPVFRSLFKAQGSVDVLPQADLDAIPKVAEEPEVELPES